jgi:hypothetical protein
MGIMVAVLEMSLSLQEVVIMAFDRSRYMPDESKFSKSGSGRPVPRQNPRVDSYTTPDNPLGKAEGPTDSDCGMPSPAPSLPMAQAPADSRPSVPGKRNL